eukprot:Opistho-1_new@5375
MHQRPNTLVVEANVLPQLFEQQVFQESVAVGHRLDVFEAKPESCNAVALDDDGLLGARIEARVVEFLALEECPILELDRVRRPVNANLAQLSKCPIRRPPQHLFSPKLRLSKTGHRVPHSVKEAPPPNVFHSFTRGRQIESACVKMSCSARHLFIKLRLCLPVVLLFRDVVVEAHAAQRRSKRRNLLHSSVVRQRVLVGDGGKSERDLVALTKGEGRVELLHKVRRRRHKRVVQPHIEWLAKSRREFAEAMPIESQHPAVVWIKAHGEMLFIRLHSLSHDVPDTSLCVILVTVPRRRPCSPGPIAVSAHSIVSTDESAVPAHCPRLDAT